LITKRVVLVLGAGASMPFGFPSGAKLKSEIVRKLESPNDTMKAIATQLEFSEDHISLFCNALKHSGKRSVDAFLEHRQEFLGIGKVATACELLSHEFRSALFGQNGSDWYEYFFNKLNTRLEEFDKNNVSVITFNYDRTLEYYLATTLENSYGIERRACFQMLNAIPIVHLYGQLGPLPLEVGGGAAFGAGLNPRTVRAAADGIQSIHEGTTSERFEQAYQLIRRAELVCFVGFGYDETNLDRLLKSRQNTSVKVVGSALGSTPAEVQVVQNIFSRHGFRQVSLDWPNGEALSFLRHHCPFD
jgi:hypothetical protein